MEQGELQTMCPGRVENRSWSKAQLPSYIANVAPPISVMTLSTHISQFLFATIALIQANRLYFLEACYFSSF